MEKIIAYNHKLEKDKKQIETQVLTIMQKKEKTKIMMSWKIVKKILTLMTLS